MLRTIPRTERVEVVLSYVLVDGGVYWSQEGLVHGVLFEQVSAFYEATQDQIDLLNSYR